MSKVEISKELLEEIRHELMTLTGLKSFDGLGENVDNGRFTTVIPNEDLIKLDFEDLVNKIDKVLDNG